jgi:hypothetical protein
MDHFYVDEAYADEDDRVKSDGHTDTYDCPCLACETWREQARREELEAESDDYTGPTYREDDE